MDLVPLSDAALAQAVTWHRQVAAMVEAADRAGVASEALPGLRARLTLQAGLVARAAAGLGAPLPALVPSPAETASAGATLGDLSPAAVTSAVRTMESTLAAVEQALTARTVATPAVPTAPANVAPLASPAAVPTTPVPVQPGPPDPWARRQPGDALAGATAAARRSLGLRNAAVYGAYSAVVLAVQVLLFLLLEESRSLPTAAPLCLLVLPALAWATGWLSIGALFASPPGGKVNRTPRLGVVICLIPNALLVAVFVLLLVLNQLT